ncbi:MULTISPECIES: cytochrome c1 [Azospira]|jgi:ubiquinol-cytochrome c reductase cytochrome c1 subunit|uniref:Cytochrome c1 n=2 Tax=Azospira oryzae TaxID=146939 RepID=G8QGQ4_AZOOP|nr:MULTISPECIES: cytochrome c1 [Azospira]TLS18008.1 MAG: cytochrome c1 [Betaproteobacteria bacterium]AEV26190.1 cytochrome c1 [Azospira oryzae PS]MBP7489138.1 cytochrome c1 [Azospira sp.]MDK9689903.1 cytochrome c1 [Azospira sp.]RZT89227.1 ubiquinol-cytochrome c reductase cytochrome c1 subunit [Azospira oryzae]
MKKLLTALLFAPLMALASGAAVHLDKAPDVSGDNAALQNGAKLFVNYCLNCHGASFMRYNRLTGIGLTEQQIKDSLLFTADKVGEPMRVAIRPDEAKQWFGATPPDLTLIARARASEAGPGADWLYTYLRSFYRDDKRPTGWNNVVFENVGMPHILWELQGQQVLNHETHKLELAVPGKLSAAEYDKQIADLVGFLVYIGEPVSGLRKQLGIAVLLFLGVLFVVAYALKREYWKDVH